MCFGFEKSIRIPVALSVVRLVHFSDSVNDNAEPPAPDDGGCLRDFGTLARRVNHGPTVNITWVKSIGIGIQMGGSGLQRVRVGDRRLARGAVPGVGNL